MSLLKKKAYYQTINKIHEFGKRQPGWHFGEGVSPSRMVLNKAKSITEKAYISGFETDAFPGIDGEIMIAVYYKNDYLEFTIETNGNITFVREKGEEQITYREGLSLNNALNELDKFGKHIWNISGTFTKTITIKGVSDSKVWLSRTHQDQVFPAYLKAAFRPSETQYVATSQNIIQEFPQLQLSIGSLPSTNYPMDAFLSNIQVTPETNAMEILWV